uniref:Uncharacterized protein n=1 Tax=Acrobeloides nanus TaxID=290746 RepID=A0A914DQZ1_9BILA
METDHLDLLKKYSKLWKMFLRGTLIIDGICSSWKNSWLPEQFNELRQFGKDRWLGLEDKENENIEFLDPYTFALKAWKNVFFQTLNNRLTDAISYLVEHERTGDRLINTKLLTDELFQSFKILDAKRINDRWAIQLRASRLKTTSYLDRNKRPKITMYDKYEFFNWFNTFVYPQIKRPRSTENITEEKLIEILDDDDNEYNIINEFLILPNENLDEVVNRNRVYSFRYGATNNIALMGLMAVIHPTALIINGPPPNVWTRRMTQDAVKEIGMIAVISGVMD